MFSTAARALAMILMLGIFFPAPASALGKMGMMPPDITLPDVLGGRHQLRDLIKDKVSLLVYWSVTCPKCRDELPQLTKLYRDMLGNPFTMILINSDGPAMAKAGEKFAKDFGLPRPFLIDSDKNDAMPFADAYDVIVTPTVLLLDKKGKLIHAQQDHIDTKKLLTAIENAF